jgi:hypothetical protein
MVVEGLIKSLFVSLFENDETCRCCPNNDVVNEPVERSPLSIWHILYPFMVDNTNYLKIKIQSRFFNLKNVGFMNYFGIFDLNFKLTFNKMPRLNELNQHFIWIIEIMNKSPFSNSPIQILLFQTRFNSFRSKRRAYFLILR